MKILIVEDEKRILDDLYDFLTLKGFVCDTAGTFEDARNMILDDDGTYDCIVIDRKLPGEKDGIELFNIIIQNKIRTNVIIFTAEKVQESEIVHGLHIGARHYLIKPVFPTVLAELLWSLPPVPQENLVSACKEIKVDKSNRICTVNGRELKGLTKFELDLLIYFLEHQTQVVSRYKRLTCLNESNKSDRTDEVIFQHVKNLRKKLRDVGIFEHIKTEQGIGYRFKCTCHEA